MTCEFIDCINGMKALPDGAFDLCLTDPPYNVAYTGKKHPWGGKIHRERAFYNDTMTDEDFTALMDGWFNEAKRVAKTVIFTPGYRNRQFWFQRENFDIFYWINAYKQGSSRVGFNRVELFLIHGPLTRRFKENILKYDFGFNGHFEDDLKLIHPHPKPVTVYKHFLARLKPANVLDPFLGSGAVAQACEELRIPWQGFEINEAYRADIDKRVVLARHKRDQESLTRWMQ